jgi:hypothetical protein
LLPHKRGGNAWAQAISKAIFKTNCGVEILYQNSLNYSRPFEIDNSSSIKLNIQNAFFFVGSYGAGGGGSAGGGGGGSYGGNRTYSQDQR